MNLRRKFLFATLAPMVLLAACGGGDDSLDDRLDIADPKVRFVHAIPLGPNVSLVRNDVVQSDATNVSYRFASRYFDVETGNATWSVRTATGNVNLGNVPFDANRGNRYSVIALPGSAAADTLLIDDPYNKGLTANNARVRIVNASFNAANVDVYVNPAGTDINTVAPNFSTVGYKNASPASGNDSVDVTPATYQVRVTEAGTKNVIFNAPVVIGVNADLLVMTLPASVAANSIKLLVVQSDDDTRTATEIETQ